LYFEAIKDRIINAKPPTKIQGNQAGIIEKDGKKYELG
jgi:hypothetical protein